LIVNALYSLEAKKSIAIFVSW